MAKPRAKSFRAWMKNTFTKGELRDIANHGADGGSQGLTYTQDTVELFDKYGDEIWDMLYEDSQNYGAANTVAFVAGFNRIDMVDTLDGFKNLMVWYAAERVAQDEVGDDD